MLHGDTFERRFPDDPDRCRRCEEVDEALGDSGVVDAAPTPAVMVFVQQSKVVRIPPLSASLRSPSASFGSIFQRYRVQEVSWQPNARLSLVVVL
jgi:hypothetical protein